MADFYHITAMVIGGMHSEPKPLAHNQAENLNSDTCYRAAQSRDARFDGVFFIAVASTKIYCRTICRVKTPLQKNCSFYTTAAAAEEAGYRPCLKCRPELAPGNSTIDATKRLALLAIERIDAGALAEGSIADLADEFGITDRHLRRVLESQFGVSPISLAQTRRLHLCKSLLTDTRLAVTDIAFASGFGSVRRFNALFKERYRLQPANFRKNKNKYQNADVLVCSLGYRPPFAWLNILQFLQARAVVGVERIENGAYRRTVAMGSARGVVAVANDLQKNLLRVELTHSLLPVFVPVLSRLKRLFDLAADPVLISRQLGSLAEHNPGLRVPGAFDAFEIAVRAILGQQITVKAATTLAGRFSKTLGEPIATESEGLTHTTPTANRVADTKIAAMTSMGIIAKRAEAIRALARAVADGQISLEPCVDVAAQIDKLVALPGIGRWTAEYIAMRCLNWPDIFLHTDLGIMKALGERSPTKILQQAEAWRPWRSYAVMHLWAGPFSLSKERGGRLALSVVEGRSG